MDKQMPPVCLKCNVAMRVDKIGIDIIEYAGGPPSREPYFPYRLYSADAFKCPTCGATVTFGNGNVGQPHESTFAARYIRMNDNPSTVKIYEHQYPPGERRLDESRDNQAV